MRRDLIRTAASLFALAVATAGCEHSENYRWSSASRPTFESLKESPSGSSFGAWDTPAVSVYSFPTPAPQATETFVRDLSPEGQAALIEAYSKTGASADELRSLLGRPLRAPPQPGGESAATAEGVYRRTVVANVTEGWSAGPGDRLVWTWIHIRPLNFLFDGYTVLATDNRVLNIEQVTNVTNASLNANLGRSASETSTTNTAGTPVSSVLATVAGATSGLGGTVGNTRTTAATINQQYVHLNADIVPDELRIFRESERNQDIAGSTQIALTARLDPATWTTALQTQAQRVTKLDLVADDGTLRAPADVTLEVTVHNAPPRCDLIADVTLYYQIRRATEGRSYIEGEQEATYEQAAYSPERPVVIVPADEVRRPSWRVYPRAAPGQALQLRDAFGIDHPLDFTSLEQARGFAEWLNQSRGLRGLKHPEIGKAGLKLSSGIDSQAVFEGEYFAMLVQQPRNLEAQCAGTRRTAQSPTP